MKCDDCQHEQHSAGHCQQCNCGDAYIVRGKSTDVYYVPSSVGDEDEVIAGRMIDRIPPRRSR